MIEFAVAGLTEPVSATVPWLSISILLPIIGALLVPFIPDSGDGKQIRWYALIVTLITFLITVAAYLTGYDPSVSGLQLSERVSWLPDLGLTWAVGADGLSMPLILLTSFITSLACLAAWPVSFKPRLFYFLLLAMDGGQIAVFAVQDMLLFFLAWELELIPVYLLLAIWGGKNDSMRPRNSFSTPREVHCSSCWSPWRWVSSGVAPQLLNTPHLQRKTSVQGSSCSVTPDFSLPSA